MNEVLQLPAARMRHRSLRLPLLSKMLPIGSILALTVIAHWLFSTPTLFSDDWYQGLDAIVSGRAAWLDWNSRRPLLFAPFLLQYQLVGANLWAQSAILLLVNAAGAILVYLIAANWGLTYNRLFATAVALLVLIYPANQTHMWLTMLHGSSALLLGLSAFYLLLLFARGGNWLIFAAAVLCLGTSFLIYEIHVGLALLWSACLLVLAWQKGWAIRIGIVSIPIMVMLFTAWRFFGYRLVGISDEYFTQISLDPLTVLNRLLFGYKLVFVWSWTDTIKQLLHVAAGTGPILLVLAAVTLLCGWLVQQLAMRRSGMPHPGRVIAADQRRAQIGVLQQYAIVAVVGVLLLGAGYLPVVTVYMPGLHGIDSRINATAVFGAAVAIGALLMLTANAVTTNRRSACAFFLGACLPLVVWGAYVQAAVALDNARSWQEQKQIWNALLTAVPDLEDDSRVVILLRGFEDRFGFGAWQRPPFAAWWDVTGGVRLLYDNRTLKADVVYLDADVPHGTKLAPEGVYNARCAETVPYEQVVAALYDPLTGTMRVLDKFPSWLVADNARANLEDVRFCPDCVLSSGLADVELRSLIQ